MFRFLKRRRRERAREKLFPAQWRRVLENNVKYYGRLSSTDRNTLEKHIFVFLEEKNFEGCGGLALTDEIRVTIAAYACILILHREADYYPRLRSILVYPSAYEAPVEEEISEGLFAEGHDTHLGESWDLGALILAWDSVKRPTRGQNVALHEFAHQLDQENDFVDGAPAIENADERCSWARVFSVEYAALIEDLEQGRRTLLDEYGASDPAEFFAVATELFFERPAQMRERHRELYEQLKAYYRQDPAALSE